MNIVENIPLKTKVKARDGDGWETSVGQAFKTNFYTANQFAAFSGDGAQNWSPVSPYTLCKSVGHRFAGDQGALYIPMANMMVWIILDDDGPIQMCLATPDELDQSKGKAWTVYDLTGPVFGLARNASFDYPQLSMGDNYFYLTFNTDTGNCVVCRFHAGALRERGTINFQYFIAVNNQWICPSVMTFDRGLFVRQADTTKLRVWVWKENTNIIPPPSDIIIDTIPSEDWATFTPAPDPVDWFAPSSLVSTDVQSATRIRNQLWVAWTGARRVRDRQENRFPFPHIGIAIIDILSMKLVQQRYLWNPDHAFAYPALTSNPNNEVALSFSWGGGKHYVQHGVGFLTGQQELQATTGDKGLDGGAHYISTRMCFPDIDRFIGAGWNAPKDASKPGGRVNEPRYVLYQR